MIASRIAIATLGIALSVSAQDSPLPPADALKSFELAPELEIELVTAEPLTASPCAMSFDERGRLFVAENRGYPIGPKPGEPSVGIIAMLEDENGDGRMDRRTVFADGLTFPNGVMPWRGGLFVTCAPDLLFLKDTDGDGRADERQVVLTGFDTKGSTQLRVNAPMLGPDGWIWLASGLSGGRITNPAHPEFGALDLKTDLRFEPHTGRFEAVDGRSQYGHSFDDFGRRFICMNRVQVQHVVLSSRDLRRNPHLAFSETVQDCPELIPNRLMRSTGGAARLYPISANVTTADSHAGTFSAACAVTIWRGGALPAPFNGAAFSCDPTGNLVHVDRLVPKGATFSAEPLIEGREFLASRDDWFRPVFLASGPDGALYVCDMYRQVIEHPDYLPEEVRKRTKFESGKDLGRIWRIRAKNAPSRPPRRNVFDDDRELAAQLASGSGWERDTALRVLAEESRVDRAAALRGFWLETNEPKGRVALLQGLAISGALYDADVEKALRDPASEVRAAALAFAKGRPAILTRLILITEERRAQSSDRERFEFALALGNVPGEEAIKALANIASSARRDRWITAAVLSSAEGRTLAVVRAMQARSISPSLPEFYNEAGGVIGRAGEAKTFSVLFGDWNRPGDDAFALLAGFANGTQRRWTMEEVNGIVDSPDGGNPFRIAAGLIMDTINRARGNSSAGRLPSVPFERGEWQSLNYAIELMERSPFELAREPLLALIHEPRADELHASAARALAAFDAPDIAEALLRQWKEWTPAKRAASLQSLASRPAHRAGILSAIERGDVPANVLSPAQRDLFLKSKDPAIRERGARLFPAAPVDRQKALADAKAALALPGNAPHGHEIFRKLCASCHRLDREGHAVGPDLFDIRNQPKENVLFHIVAPEAEVAPAFTPYLAETRDGRTLAGVLSSETSTSVTMRMPLGQETTVLRSDLVALTATPGSLMPPGLDAAMSLQEFADLLAYLKGEKER